ncbi:MAG: ribbon-helix-helix protein, CopG family [Pseudonocardiaceae bacterium]
MTRRLQVLLDEARYGRLEQHAARRGASIATLVREAIDAAFPDDGPDRSEAVRRLLDAAPIQVSDWSLMKDEIDQMYESTAG